MHVCPTVSVMFSYTMASSSKPADKHCNVFLTHSISHVLLHHGQFFETSRQTLQCISDTQYQSCSPTPWPVLRNLQTVNATQVWRTGRICSCPGPPNIGPTGNQHNEDLTRSVSHGQISIPRPTPSNLKQTTS